MSLFNQAPLPPFLQLAHDVLSGSHRFAAGIVKRTFAEFGDPWAVQFETACRAMFPQPDQFEKALRGYAAFAITSLRLQLDFDRAGEYAAKTYAEASAEVYQNDAYMVEEYLPGLFLSHYLWPHHYRQLQFFESAFVEWLAASQQPEFLEVGVGTGLYSRLALQRLPAASGRGVDISPSSQRFASAQAEAFGFAGRYRVDLEDVLTQTPDASAGALISVELLEHLEDPVSMLRGFHRVLRPGGRAFITAAITAAHTDHIYLYRSAEEVEAHLRQAGFQILQYFVGYAYDARSPGVAVPTAAAFVVHR